MSPNHFRLGVRHCGTIWTCRAYLNRAYLIDALSINDTSTTLQDQVYQEADSGNLNTFGVFSYIVACSLTTPFVPNLNLNQPMNQSGGFDPGSNTSFNYTPQNGTPAGITTIFFGSIDTLSVKTVPSPGTRLMLAGFGFSSRMRNHAGSMREERSPISASRISTARSVCQRSRQCRWYTKQTAQQIA